MNSFIKALIVVAGIIFLVVAAAGVGGYLWFKHNKAALMESATWRIQMCRKYELKDSNNMIFQEVQEYCDECRKTTK